MTTPEQITVSLEWAKKLRDAGFPQGWTGVGTAESFTERPESMKGSLDGSYFKWFQDKDGNPLVESVYCNYAMIAAAPTAEEILRELGCGKLYFSGDGRWVVALEGQEVLKDIPTENSAANAAAAMYCYLAKNNLLPTP
jgi:hypothetical protein